MAAVIIEPKVSWKQLKCLTDEQINKMRSVCTMEYYSAIERNGVLIYVTAWEDLENITLSDISQTEQDSIV